MKFTKLYCAIALSMITSHVEASSYAGWLTQIGETDAIMQVSNGGKGITIGVVDTGVGGNSFTFAKGQVTGATDVNGHGTAVAEIAAGNTPSKMNIGSGGYNTQVGNQLSVAPNANIYSYQAVGATGLGSTSSFVAGIKAAADAGSQVINASLSFQNDPTIVSAMNYAASKGAIIVVSANNNNTSFMNGASMSGLTAKTISQMIIVGSVNSTGAKSSFSNVPGNGTLSGTPYASRWINAPGENILAPYYISFMPNFVTYLSWTGTSMSAPMVSGSVALLDSTWKVLQTQGTAANLLLATQKNGQLNLTNAFSPVGNLTVFQANGTSVPVSSLTGVMLNNGALGNLASIKSTLSNYTAFDGYNRNFTVDLSKLIVTSSVSPGTTTTASLVTKAASPTKYSDSFLSDVNDNRYYGSNGQSLYNHNVVFYSDESTYTRHEYLDSNSDMFSLNDSVNSKTISLGGKIDKDTRYKFAVKNNLNSFASEFGVNHFIDNRFSAAVTFQNLSEDGVFLGNNMGSMFNISKSYTQGLQSSLTYKIDDKMGISVQHDKMWSTGQNVNTISESFGVALNVDNVVFGIKQPLHVISGSTAIPIGYADGTNGLPSVRMQAVSLKSDAIETDFHIGYATQLNKTQTLNVRFDHMQNYMNTSNYNNSSVVVGWNMKF